MNLRIIFAALFVVVGLFPAAAEQPFTYGVFEPSVTHLDLETCPKELAADEVFCRLAIGHDELHVFAFSEKGDQPLVGFKSYGEGEYYIILK